MAAAPAPQKTGLAEASCNYVAQDEIWKAHVLQEKSAAVKWPDNWDFMTTKYKDLVKDDFPTQDREKALPPTPLQLPHVTPIHELVDVRPSPRPVPNCTSQMIGWRSSQKDLALERYGGYAKPKGGLVKQLKWPNEAVD